MNGLWENNFVVTWEFRKSPEIQCTSASSILEGMQKQFNDTKKKFSTEISFFYLYLYAGTAFLHAGGKKTDTSEETWWGQTSIKLINF